VCSKSRRKRTDAGITDRSYCSSGIIRIRSTEQCMDAHCLENLWAIISGLNKWHNLTQPLLPQKACAPISVKQAEELSHEYGLGYRQVTLRMDSRYTSQWNTGNKKTHYSKRRTLFASMAYVMYQLPMTARWGKGPLGSSLQSLSRWRNWD
jgi:hypothetical protein